MTRPRPFLKAALLLICLFFIGCGVKKAPVVEAQAVQEDEAWICMLDVGKGDAILIRTAGKTYLIDTGKKEYYGVLEAAFAYFGITELDGVILTHTDKDHAGGITKLSKSGIGVGTWYASEYWDEGKKKHPAEKAADKRGEDAIFLKAGDTVDGIFTVSGPVKEAKDENNNSLVMKAELNGVTVLLTGDMEFKEEESVLLTGADLSADILKVPHHGNKDACSAELVRAVNPKLALISTDSAEKPDTPHEMVLENLKNAEVHCTDTEGNILVTCTGGTYTVSFPDFE